MMDAGFAFDTTPKTLAVGAADQNSTNVHDAGAAKKIFGGFSPRPPKFTGVYTLTAGTGARSFRARLVGSAAAGLTTPGILADTGVQLLDKDGTALGTGDRVEWEIPVVGQRVAYQYYGAIYAQGTADQQGTVTCAVVLDAQSNMVAPKAATP